MESTTGILYSGNVMLKLDVGGSVVDVHKHHNKGTSALFRLITKSLAGENVEKEKPNYVDLRYSSNGVDWVSCLSRPQSVTQIYSVMEYGSWVTRVASMIPYISILSSAEDTDPNTKFRVYLMSNEVDLAYISVDRNEVMTIRPGTQALVEWVLKFVNSEE